MGAWGTGIFEDDMALDALSEIESLDNPVEYFTASFEEVVNSTDYLEYDEGYRAIVSSVFVDGILNPEKNGNYGAVIDTAIERLKNVQVSDLRDLAVAALHRILEDGSELNELWSENNEQYQVWKGNIQELIDRLSLNR